MSNKKAWLLPPLSWFPENSFGQSNSVTCNVFWIFKILLPIFCPFILEAVSTILPNYCSIDSVDYRIPWMNTTFTDKLINHCIKFWRLIVEIEVGVIIQCRFKDPSSMIQKFVHSFFFFFSLITSRFCPHCSHLML